MTADLSQIVKAYDVRGVVPDQWDEHLSALFGAAFAQVTAVPAGSGAIVVGHDMRPSSPGLSHAFARGAAEQGLDVVEIGLCSTDQLYYASGALDLPGAMFTASHNPAQYNGIKLCRAGAAPVGQDTGLADIRALVELAGRPRLGPRPRRHPRHPQPPRHPRRLRRVPPLAGRRERHPPAQGRRRRRQRHGRPHRPHRPRRPPPHRRPALLRTGRHLPEPRGQPPRPQEPGRPPGPRPRRGRRPRPRLRRRRRPLLRRGRARRAGLPLRRHRPGRRPRTGPQRRPRHRHPQPHHLVVGPRGGPRARRHPARTRVGHSFIKAEMAATGAIFGGEHSAHYYFRDFWNADTGMLAALHVLAALGGQPAPSPPWSPSTTATRPPARSTPPSPTSRPPPPASAPPTPTTPPPPPTPSTASPSPPPTGGSTSAPPTPNPSSASTSKPATARPWNG